MGEVNPAVIKKTQDILGKFIKRPPLTDKLLRKPPFRFLHDVVTSVVRETKFLDGLFSVEEMNSEYVIDKESKMAFLQKVIDVVNIACGVSLGVRPAKIVAGYEPEKTNELLQIIGRAIEKKVDSSAAVHRVLSKTKSTKESAQPTAKKSHPNKEQEKMKKTGQEAPEKKARDKAGSDASKKKTTNLAKGEGREKKKSAASQEKVATNQEDSKKSRNALKDNKSKRNEDKTVNGDLKVESKTKATPREKRSVEGGAARGALGRERKGVSAGRRGEREVGEEEDAGVVEVVAEEELGVAAEEVAKLHAAGDVPEEAAFGGGGEREADEAALGESRIGDGLVREEAKEEDAGGDTIRDGAHNMRQPVTAEEPRRSAAGPGQQQGQRVAISTPVVRPSSVASRAPRPRSSRPHAPRLRSALLPGAAAAEGGQQDGGAEKKAQECVLGDEDDAAAEFVVEEARPPSFDAVSRPPASLVDAGEVSGGGTGLLVAKILETKKELEESGGAAAAGRDKSAHVQQVQYEAGGEERRRSGGAGRVDGLRCTVQAIARAAHPLGSLVAVLHDSVDAMRLETAGWRSESERLLAVLADEQREMELELEPLCLVLADVEQRVAVEREVVSAAKARVLKAELRIHAMLDPKGREGPKQPEFHRLLPC